MESVSRDARVFLRGEHLLVSIGWRRLGLYDSDVERFGIPEYLCTYTVTYTLDAVGEFIVTSDGVAIQRVDPPTDDALPVCFLPRDWAGQRVSIVRTNIRRTG